MNKLLKEAEKYTIYATVFLLPLVFLSSFFNPLLTPKITILVFGVCLAILLRVVRFAVSGTFEFHIGQFDVPVFVIMLAYFLSAYITSPSKVDAFFLPGTATIFIAAGFLYFLANQMEARDKAKLLYVLLSSAVAVSLMYLFAVVGIFEHMPSLPAFMQSRSFTTLGALLPTALFMLIAVFYGLGIVLNAKDASKKILVACATAIIAIGFVISGFNMLTNRDNFKLASLDASVSVALDTLKTSTLFGAGPSNYLTAYTRFRPLSTNAGDDWTTRYTQARNMYFTTLTETGLAGIFGFILLVIVAAKIFNSEVKFREIQRLPLLDNRIAATVVLLILLAIFPASAPEIVVLLFISLALASKTKRIGMSPAASQGVHMNDGRSKLPSVVLATIVILPILYILITGGRVLAAERTYKVAVDHLAANEGTQAYDTLQKAINTNPNVDRYHATYSQVNFILANAIARKEDITDADRQTIARLIDQSIREAKSTVAINPLRAGNWEVLGNTYKSIMPLSKDAAGFAIQSYSQAVGLDPINPNLRIALGGVWYAVQNYDNAIDTFKLAVVAKRDHANAHYNLAIAYREKGEIEKAIAELNAVLTLVKPDSKDYQTVKDEIDNLQSKKPAETTPANGETISAPTKNEPAINPQIELPESAAPEVSPSPSPVPTNTPSPSPAQ